MATHVQGHDGSRLHVVRVPVKLDREWQEAIDAVGPDVMGHGWFVRKVGDEYPPRPGEPKDEEITLVNLDKIIPNAQYAVDWGKQHGLTPKSPRSVFAVGEHKPRLHRELKLNSMAIVAPVPRTFGGNRWVCSVWLGDGGCYCVLDWFGLDFDAYYWFAFGRE